MIKPWATSIKARVLEDSNFIGSPKKKENEKNRKEMKEPKIISLHSSPFKSPTQAGS